MDETELRAKAQHYRRMAAQVTDDELATAMRDLAACYEAEADALAAKRESNSRSS